MTRPVSKDAWDFVKVGKVYQYKEDSLVCFVKVLEDNSTDKHYAFKLRVEQSNIDMKGDREFSVSASKSNTGVYSGMLQLYEKPEYMPLPVGTSWPYDYSECRNG